MPSIFSPAGRAQIRSQHRRRLRPVTAAAKARTYETDPVAYAEQVLGITTLWDVQKDVLRSLLVPPCRVLVASGHDVGKTFVAALALNWWYDTFNPGVVISTAPSSREVKQ